MISTPARESLNFRLSKQKLMLLLACNFVEKDLVVSLTYRDNDRPKTRAEADRRLSLFIRYLRKARKEANKELKYIRVTEGYHSGKKLHHHLILNSTGNDYATIRSLWRWGDNVDIEPFGPDGIVHQSDYLTKEPIKLGQVHVGDRTWRASIHMRKPIVTYEFVSESNSLQAPVGTKVIDRTECNNSYGHFVTIVAKSQN